MALAKLVSIIGRQLPPTPWVEGDNIPWQDPAFSERMLVEHLSQEHHLASRRTLSIEAHVRFIERQLPGLDPAHILDLGCGPGLYLHRLARRGHRGHGIDFSPAAINHARSVAAREELDCHFEQADLRHADFGEDFDLVLLLYGQINVFTRQHARDILQRAHAALAPGGTLLLEPQTPAAVRGSVDNTTDWTASEHGLFTSRPHVLLHERFWDEPSRTATERWHVIDAETGAVDCHAMSSCSYDRDELVDVLRSVGFERIVTHRSLAGDEAAATADLFVLAASRPAGLEPTGGETSG